MDEKLKEIILASHTHACAEGQVHWQKDEVVDRAVSLGMLKGKVRYIPTFAYRQLLYERRTSSGCELCELIENKEGLLSLPSGSKFNNYFAISFNNFPYLDGQMLISSRTHSEEFTKEQLQYLFMFMESTKFLGAALQLKGSGATIPGHAHLSIFNEELPIFHSTYKPISQFEDTIISMSIEHPSLCYKVYGGLLNKRLLATQKIMKKLRESNLSYNFYLDSAAQSYIVPRTHQRALSVDMKVGLSLPAGIYNGYIEKTEAGTLEAIQAEIWHHCQSIKNNQLLQALVETTVEKSRAREFLL